MYNAKKLKVLTLVLAVVFTLTAVLAGCGKSVDTTKEKASEQSSKVEASTVESTQQQLSPVTLKWYMPGSEEPAKDEVMQAVNKILKEKINATLDLTNLDWGSYLEKVKLMSASSDPFDIFFCAGWMDFAGHVARGGLLPIDELLDKYGTDIKAAVPEGYWSGAKINGKTYAVPSTWQGAFMTGWAIKKDIADKYGVDLKKTYTLKDLEPLLEQIKKNEKDVIPYLPANNNTNNVNSINNEKYDPLASNIVYNIESGKPEFYFNVPEVRDDLKLLRKFYEKGYLAKDAATMKDQVAASKSGKYAVVFSTNAQDEGGFASDYYGMPVSSIVAKGNFLITTSYVQCLMNGISRTSKNPERAMMFLNLMWSDKNLINTVCFGVEGKHYKMVDSDIIERIPNAGWVQYPGYLTSYRLAFFESKWQKGAIPREDESMKVSKVSPLLGFVFNPEPVKNENAQISAIIAEMSPVLMCGVHPDPDKYIDEMYNKMKQAGWDKLIAEYEKQIAEWKVANGK